MYPRVMMNLAWTMMLSITLTSCSSQPDLQSEPPASYSSETTNPHQMQASGHAPTAHPSASSTPRITRSETPDPPIPDQAPVPSVTPTSPRVAAETTPAPVNPPSPHKIITKTQSSPKNVPDKTVKQNQSAAVQSKRLTLSQLVKMYPKLLRTSGTSSGKKIALTFDDAPDLKFTPQVLDILKKYHVQATFFILGVQAEKHPEIVKRIASEGHVIGNHSFSHRLFTKLDDEAFQHQIVRTQNTLQRLIGYNPKLIRPPYGEISENQLLWTSEHGYLVVNWNVDSMDWKELKEPQVTSNILKNIRSGSIVLQHSGGGASQDLSGTVRALPKIIERLQAQGYRLVTLPELLNVSKEK